ncbi:hypothetical protein ACWD5V_34600 [Streptomyces sp. NPDC002523]
MKNYPPQFKADVVALYQSRPEATIRRSLPIWDQSRDLAGLGLGDWYEPAVGRLGGGAG